MEFCKLTDSEFDDFARAHAQSNFTQSLPILESQRARGASVEVFGIKKDGVVEAAGIISYRKQRFGYTVAEVIKGPLLDYRNQELVDFTMQELSDYARTKGADELIISPYIVHKQRNLDGEIVENGDDNSDLITELESAGFTHLGFAENLVNINWMVTKNIRYDSDEALFASVSNRTRRAAIKNADRYGVKVAEVTLDNLDVFYDIVKNASETKHFVARNREFYENLLKTVDSKYLKIMISYLNIADYTANLKELIAAETERQQQIQQQLAQKDSPNNQRKLEVSTNLIKKYQTSLDEVPGLPAKDGMLPLAGVYFFCYGCEIVAAIGGADDRFRQFDGATALYWHMMKYGRANGYEIFNFYGTFGIFDPASPGHKIYQFKKGWGGEVVELLGEFRKPLRPLRASLFRVLKSFARS